MKEVGLKPTSSQLKEMMAECDTSGSNFIPFSEFLSVLAAKLRNTSRSDILLQSFASFDPDSKGYIPASELKKTSYNLGKSSFTTRMVCNVKRN